MDASSFIDGQSLRAVAPATFRAERPFPWIALRGFLTRDAFAELAADFPELRLFEWHENKAKPHGQRPHDRFYLAYERSIYHPRGAPERGVVAHAALRPSWQRFLSELGSDEYRRFLASLVGTESFEVRYAWHVGIAGSEVSPHCDVPEKLGTHVFYFNTSDDWRPEWGGETLVLSGKHTPRMNPDFDDFETVARVPFLDNQSFLFRNGPDAWHGARALRCPPGSHRRLFNVIVTRRPRSAVRRFLEACASLGLGRR